MRHARIAVAIWLATCSQAIAVVNIRITTVGGSIITRVEPNDTNFSIQVDNATSEIRVWTNQDQNIGEITLLNQGGLQTVDFILSSSGSAVTTSPLATPGCRNWRGLSVVPPRRGVNFSGFVAGDLTGSVAVSRIWWFGVDGVVQGSIEKGVDAADMSGACILQLGSKSEAGRILVRGGNLTELRVAGDFLSDLDVQAGNINNVRIGGNIGAASQNPRKIWTVTNGISRIEARDVYALIDSQFGTTPATISSDIVLSGNLFGVMRTGVFSTVSISGSLVGALNIQQPVPSDRIIQIGNGLGPNAIIRMQSSGLAGRVFLNANNSIGNWESGGRVQMSIFAAPPTDTVILTGSEYTQLSASLGGGSVGLVPFRLHRTDSFPAQASATDSPVVLPGVLAPTPGSPIRMRHYGPVRWETADGAPFIVERRAIGAASGDPWSDESACFTMSLATNTNVVELTPSVQLQRGFEYASRAAPSPRRARTCCGPICRRG